LKAAQRALTRGGEPVALGSRAMDILLFLVENAGRLVTHADIVKHAWPDTFVDDTNLRVHISTLRRVLGDTKSESRYIANVPGRGYSFIAEIVREVPAPPVPSGHPDVATDNRTGPIPFHADIVGREAAVALLGEQIENARLVSVVGPGGIGKSTVVRAVVSLAARQTIWVDLAELASGDLIATEVASKLDILSRSDDINAEIAKALEGRDIVIVLDSCEHVVDAAAVFVEAILGSTSTPRFIATSREPLRAYGEWVHRLDPLALPGEGATVGEASRTAAVQLFVRRAAASRGGYDLADEDAAHVGDICRRLDGIALAIELAAARMDRMSAKAIAASLDNRFRLLTRGRRTALLRHQTLRATLDWSYLVLSPEEQRALRLLSIFRGSFTAAAADAVIDAPQAEALLDDLVSKSLVSVEPLSDGNRFRLLDTTRFYASEKLDESGETAEAVERLIRFLTELLETHEHVLYSTAMEDWPEDFAHHVPSLRLALERAFGPAGHVLAGVRLTVAALPLFFRLSLLDECLVFVTRALSYLDSHPDTDERRRMKLYAALGWPQMRSTDAPQKGVDAWSTALAIAEKLGDLDYQLRAVWALWVDAVNRAQPLLGHELAEMFQARAAMSPDPVDAVIGKRIMGATLHWLGRHEEARALLEDMIREYDALPPTTRFQFDQGATARIILARCLWVLGQGERALKLVQETVDYTFSIGHELSLTNVLAEAGCPLALLEGDLDLAERYIALLAEHTKSLSLDVWSAYARCFDADVSLRRGRPEECLSALRPSMAILDAAGFTLFKTAFQTTEAQALASLGRTTEAIEVIDAALRDSQTSGERWCLPELLRVKARLLLDSGTDEAADLVISVFQAALEAARADHAVQWERRISADLSLAVAAGDGRFPPHGRVPPDGHEHPVLH
jgi:predicted ATPase/DNA-binding winged helix-turn-helix (wHTH) protein